MSETSNEDRPGQLRWLLVAQFFGAFNDNAWKLVVIVLISRTTLFQDASDPETAEQARTMLAFCVLTLPLMLFSLPAGALSDRVSKRTVILGMKALELVLMSSAAVLLFFWPGSYVAPLTILGLMGLQSALFSPSKYGILPELVHHEKLSAANGSLELWTFVAIIAGTVFGPIILESAGVAWGAGLALAGLSAVGFAAALRIPKVPPARAEGGVFSTIGEAWRTIRKSRTLWLAILGLTWFWALASLLGQDMVVYSRQILKLSDELTGLPLGLFGIGVGLGSYWAGRISGKNVEMGLIPLGALGLGLSTFLLGAIGPGVIGTGFFATLLGVSSGFLVVPLNALLQWRAPADRRGSVIALANVLQFGGMLLGSLSGWLMAEASLSTRGILIGAALLTFVGTAWASWLLPEAFLRFVLFLFTHSLYRVKVLGRENVPESGGVLLTPNHMSFADGLFLIATLDRPVRFVIDEDQFNRPLVRPFLKLMRAIPIPASGGPKQVLRALRQAGDYLDAGAVVCIFPEGQITRIGAMLPFRRGLEKVARGRTAQIVPVHLDRVWGSLFSYSGNRFVIKLPERIPYPVTVSFGEPLSSDTPFMEVRRAVIDLGERAWHERKADARPLHRTFIRRARRHPWRFLLADAEGRQLNRLKTLAGAVVMGRKLAPRWKDQQYVGLLLPPSIAGALANLAAALAGRTAVNLNYTAGREASESAVAQAGLKTLVTSRRFVEKAGLSLPAGVEPIWLEDLMTSVSGIDRALAFLGAALLPSRLLERWCGSQKATAMDDVATVVFSSGSTGQPKGVMLTHFNLDSNVAAVAQIFRPMQSDRLLGVLPLFHSFGYMALWFSLNRGVPTAFHVNPLDAPTVARVVSEHRVTLLLATPTFLSLYLRRCPAEQFGSLRLVMAAAEKLHERLADEFEETFGIRPLEGYGATECSPVVAASVPPYRGPGLFQVGHRRGFVGPPLPGVTVRIVDVDSGEPVAQGETGLLLVRGPNVMKGYLGRDDLTREAMRDGWYVTGDIALQDGDGFIQITDRLARFSKIGGEMVPHVRVEEALHEALGAGGTRCFAVTAVTDDQKGERLAVVTTIDTEQVPELLEKVKEAGLPNIYLPRANSFIRIDELPVLGTGKLDLAALKEIARERLSS